MISDDVYYYILDGKAYFKDFTRASWYIKLIKHNELVKDISPQNAKEKVNTILNELKNALGEY
jgi:hypothetical protein